MDIDDENSITRDLQRVALSVENHPVKIKALQDVKSIPIGSGKSGPFRKGNNYLIPLWQATVLREFHWVEFDDHPSINRSEIQKQISRESAAQKLSELPDHFYILARDEEDVLQAHLKVNLETMDNVKRFHAYLYDLMQARLSKILKLATSSTTRATIRDLPEEEQLLLTRLSKLITDWTSFFLRTEKS